VGKITCVSVGKRNRIVEVGGGVFVGEAVDVGRTVGVSVGGMTLAVWVCAAAAVSKMTVSAPPGTGLDNGGADNAGTWQANRISRIPSDNRILCALDFRKNRIDFTSL
jgi:hypothetical protein